ncbi:hypothetical protein TWF718_000164 [Orbilia javanica]|uniref:Uncharacterized protein n=1 Tax=Orbilia javanica TaxID=47235 RepID=A0AAN8RLS7_9PEZI
MSERYLPESENGNPFEACPSNRNSPGFTTRLENKVSERIRKWKCRHQERAPELAIQVNLSTTRPERTDEGRNIQRPWTREIKRLLKRLPASHYEMFMIHRAHGYHGMLYPENSNRRYWRAYEIGRLERLWEDSSNDQQNPADSASGQINAHLQRIAEYFNTEVDEHGNFKALSSDQTSSFKEWCSQTRVTITPPPSMEKLPYSKEMYAPRELNFKPTVKHGNDFCVVTDPKQNHGSGRNSRHESKGRTIMIKPGFAGKPFFPLYKPSLQRQPLNKEPTKAKQIPGAGYITPQRTPNKKKSTRWPGMFSTSTPDRTPNKSIPPWNAAFENSNKPVGPGGFINLVNFPAYLLAEEYKHMVCNPKWNTPKPWRHGLERIFNSIPLVSHQKEYIKYYTLGYEGIWPGDAPGILMEQAFLFGVMEKQWDVEVENSLHRFYHGISDDGALKGVPHYYYAVLD